jgi:hypothetical protein
MWREPEKMDCTKWETIYVSLTIWANHCTWRMRNSHFLLPVSDAGPGHCESVHAQQPIEASQCVSVNNLHPKGTVQANLLLPIGML